MKTLSAALVYGLSMTPPALAQSFGYAFEGQWDCGNGTVAFTDQTYFNGSDTLTMTEVEESTEAFVLRFVDDTQIVLSDVTETSMEWMGDSGLSQSCARVQ